MHFISSRRHVCTVLEGDLYLCTLCHLSLSDCEMQGEKGAAEDKPEAEETEQEKRKRRAERFKEELARQKAAKGFGKGAAEKVSEEEKMKARKAKCVQLNFTFLISELHCFSCFVCLYQVVTDLQYHVCRFAPLTSKGSDAAKAPAADKAKVGKVVCILFTDSPVHKARFFKNQGPRVTSILSKNLLLLLAVGCPSDGGEVRQGRGKSTKL